ncbi:MAG: glycosyltransferase family 2 protein [Actinomycetota bacterium]
MRVAVVIVTHNSADDLPALLDSVPERSGDHVLEVVVVDSGSGDDSLAVALAHRPAATAVDLGANRGYAAGVNAGWAAAVDVDAMLLLNPDLTVDPGAVEPWLSALDADGGIVAPRIRNLDGHLEPALRRRPTVWRAAVEALIGGRLAARLGLGELIPEPDGGDTTRRADWASGAALAISRDCLDAVGPWEERFFLYSEETDFCLRAGDAGFAITSAPDAGVVHRGGEFSVSEPLYSLLTWNRVRLMRARHGARRGAAMRVAVSVGEAMRAVVGARSGVHRAALGCLWSDARRSAVLPPESHLSWTGAR